MMTSNRQLYFEVHGYGWTVSENADGQFVGICHPTPGMTLTIRAASTEEAKQAAADAIAGYEKDMLDLETTLVDVKAPKEEEEEP